MMLKNVFGRRPNDDEERVGLLVDRVCKGSATGKRIVEGALARGVKIEMSDEIDSIGSFRQDDNLILLNSSFNNSVLVSTLVHEARHSEQPIAIGSSEYSVFSSVAIVRAKEADAMAYQCRAAAEMAENGDCNPLQMLASNHNGIVNAYIHGTNPLSDSFKAWYDDKNYVNKYDNRTLLLCDHGQFTRNAFKKTLSGQELTACFCDENGKAYIDPLFFSSKRASTVSKRQADTAADIEKRHVRNVLKFGDVPTSADKFFVVLANGSVEIPREIKRREEALAAKLFAKRKGR